MVQINGKLDIEYISWVYHDGSVTIMDCGHIAGNRRKKKKVRGICFYQILDLLATAKVVAAGNNFFFF